MTKIFPNLALTDATEIYFDGVPVSVKSFSISGENGEFADIALADGRTVRTRRDIQLEAAHYYVEERFFFPNPPKNRSEAAEALRMFEKFISAATFIYRTEGFSACVVGECNEEFCEHRVSFHIENNVVDDDLFPVFEADPYNSDRWVYIREHREELQRMIDEDED